MAQLKIKKHEVYNYIANHPEWFGEDRYLSCAQIANHINRILRKESDDFIVLRGSTLTAMVYDLVLTRTYDETLHCYTYRPILPIVEDYKSLTF